ncbi:hypothetical protein FRC17_010667 [Serendipita sp. 399]|nr:hypothetical protein FRC17_010667 [Serendipita sp. 399]
MPRRGRRQEVEDEEMRAQEGENASAAPAAAAAPVGQVGEELPPFDPKNFQNQPISASNHAKIRTITESWDVPAASLDHLGQLVREAAVLLTEVSADPMLLRDLDKTMKEVVDQQAALNARREAALDIRRDLTDGTKIVDPATNWSARFDERLAAYEKQTSRQKYANNALYKEYKEEIWGADPENEGAMPPLSSMIPKEDGDEDDSDDEVEVGGMAKSYRDPLTRAWLENPMKSKLCGHVYSQASIFDFLRAGPADCPAAGCDKKISKKDLEPDEDMARQVRNAKRREEESQNKGRKKQNRIVIDDDDDEIVD